MEKQIIDILKNIKPGVNLESSSNLVEDGVIDSFDIITLISELNDTFNCSIGVLDLEPENFKTIDTITELVKRAAE